MNNAWYKTRTIDTLMREFNNRETMNAVAASMFAVIAAALSIFNPIIAIAKSLHSGNDPRLNPVAGYAILLIAIVSVVLSVKWYLQSRTKRVEWGIICATALFALVLASTNVFAERWILHIYTNLNI